MSCRCNCGYLALLAGIFAGVLAGVLYALGFITLGVVFWAYLAVGVLGLLLTPLYATGACGAGCSDCFARYRRQILAAAIGTIVTAVLGLLLAPVATVVVLAIALGIATLFVVLLLATLVCLTECLCDN